MSTYKKAGVDKEEGYRTVAKIKKAVERTHNVNVLNTLGGFGAFYQLSGYKNPVLISGADGVGTKLCLALKYQKYSSIGVDCFAMCANDILCHGARPLFFLDYIACGKLNAEVASEIIYGMASACRATGAALIGGETAEMPGMYRSGDYDVAGFCVGALEREKIIDGKAIAQGDVLIGFPSSGIHSNGFSLIRTIFSDADLSKDFHGVPLYETLLEPTRLYHDLIHKLLDRFPIRGLAHITGGGLVENIPRIIPEGLCALIEVPKITVQPVFKHIQSIGKVSEEEMWGTFNMGIGMVAVISSKDQKAVFQYMKSLDEKFFVIGSIERGSEKISFKNKFVQPL